MTVSNDSFCILSNQPVRYQSGYDLHSVQMCPQNHAFHMFISPNATCFVHSPFGVRPVLLRSWWGGECTTDFYSLGNAYLYLCGSRGFCSCDKTKYKMKNLNTDIETQRPL